MSTGKVNPTIIALIVGGAFLMQQIDTTVITTALPEMAKSLDTDPIHLAVGVTAYLLALSVFMPASGWAADRFGAQVMFGSAVFVFTLGSVLCGICNNVAELTAARTLQGMGGSMMVPVGRLLLYRSADKAELIKLMIIQTLPQTFGPVIGPVMGGFVVSQWSWRWIFLINVPLGALGILLTLRFLPNYKETPPQSLNWTSFLISGLALSVLMSGLEMLSHGNDAVEGLALVAIGLTLCAVVVWHARRTANSVLDLGLFRIRTFAVNFWGGGAYRLGAGAVVYLFPLLFQSALGMSPIMSGLLTLSSAVGSLASRPIMPGMLRRFGYRTLLLWNGALTAASIASGAFITGETPIWVIVSIVALTGLVQSMQYTGMQTICMADVPTRQMAGATGLSSVSNQFFRGLGVAVSAIILNAVLNIMGFPRINLRAMQITFVCAGIFSLVSLLDYRRLDPDAGANVSGRKASA